MRIERWKNLFCASFISFQMIKKIFFIPLMSQRDDDDEDYYEDAHTHIPTWVNFLIQTRMRALGRWLRMSKQIAKGSNGILFMHLLSIWEHIIRNIWKVFWISILLNKPAKMSFHIVLIWMVSFFVSREEKHLKSNVNKEEVLVKLGWIFFKVLDSFVVYLFTFYLYYFFIPNNSYLLL
jgi:hypothetical protein